MRMAARLERPLGGFRAGNGNGHRLVIATIEDVVYLEGGRTPGDEDSCRDDDLRALLVNGRWTFVHNDSVPYQRAWRALC
jgi:uncharacterized cupin superfamily protein